MAKGYMVVDMPENCKQCGFVSRREQQLIPGWYRTYWVCQAQFCKIQDEKKAQISLDGDKPDWCPIKEINGRVDL